MEKLELHQSSLARIKAMKFGEPVTNICAGIENPHRLGYFVKLVIKSHRNRYGITHKDYSAQITDGKGYFGDYGIEVIYPGHLDYETCCKLFGSVYAAIYGVKAS